MELVKNILTLPLPTQEETCLQSERPAANSGEVLENLVDDVSGWLLSRWPSQVSRLPLAVKNAAVSGWMEVLSDMTLNEILRAKTLCEAKPYPPDPAAFKAAGERVDAAEQFHAAVNSASCIPPAWHQLTARTFTAAQWMWAEGFDLREIDWNRRGVQDSWVRIYRKACRMEEANPACLLQPPLPPVGLLTVKPDRDGYLRRRETIFAVIGARPPER